MATSGKKGGKGILVYSSALFGALIGIWSTAAFISGLAQVNWQFSELLRQYLIAIGVIQEFHTLVDFYTHIKGVEYIICVLFLSAFPVFFSYVNKSKTEVESA